MPRKTVLRPKFLVRDLISITPGSSGTTAVRSARPGVCGWMQGRARYILPHQGLQARLELLAPGAMFGLGNFSGLECIVQLGQGLKELVAVEAAGRGCG